MLLTRLAQPSNTGSCVSPCSSVTGSKLVPPGMMRSCDGSFDERHFTGSVFFLSAPILRRPATTLPSMMTWNLNVRYGSCRWAFTVNNGAAMIYTLPGGRRITRRLLSDLLLDADDDELGRLDRSEAD